MPQTQIGAIHLENHYDEERGTVTLTARRGEDRFSQTVRVTSAQQAETVWLGWQLIYKEATKDDPMDYGEWPDLIESEDA